MKNNFALTTILVLVGILVLGSIGVLAQEGSGLPNEVNRPEFDLDADAIEAKDITIGFSQCVMDHPYRIDMVERAEAAAEEYGADIIVTDGQGKASREVSNIESMIARKVDVIIISSHGGTAIKPGIDQAEEAGIPVILIDGGRPFKEWEFVSWMSTDDWQLGRRAGDLLAADLSGSGKVAMIEGTPGSTCTQGRHDGFLKTVTDYSNIEIVAEQQANWLRLNSLNLVTNILQSHPDLDAVYSHNDEMALGAIEAIKKAGLKPGEDVLVYSAGDQQSTGLAAIEEGELQLTQKYSNEGGYAVKAALHYLMGGELPKMINMGTTFITRDNVENFEPVY